MIRSVLVLVCGLMLGLLVWKGLVATYANDVAYNAHVCAVYGYESDCITPLPADRRLQ